MERMETNGLLDYTSKTELKSYSVTRGSSVSHTSLMNKKWWLGFCFAVLGFLLLLYLPVYHELQTRIGETWEQTVGMHCFLLFCTSHTRYIQFIKSNEKNNVQNKTQKAFRCSRFSVSIMNQMKIRLKS